MKKVVWGLVALASFVVGTTAHGLTFTATGHGDDTNETLSASATFAISDLKLVITLSNTATFDPDDCADILTGIFFALAGDPALTPVTALLGPDTAIKDRPGASGPGMNVGGEWAYRNDLTGLPHGANEGISCTRLKKFNQHFRFPGPNLQGPVSPGKVQYGVTTDFDNMGNDKGGLKHQQLVENTVIFMLDDLPSNFTLADITDVSFQYGTSLKDATIAGTSGVLVVPEPSTVALVAVGLLGAFASTRQSTTTKT